MKTYTVVLDIKGFSKLTSELMRLGKEGAELLSEELNFFFSGIERYSAQCGLEQIFFSGDALTYIGENGSDAAVFVKNVIDFFKKEGKRTVKGIEFRLSIRAGISRGELKKTGLPGLGTIYEGAPLKNAAAGISRVGANSFYSDTPLPVIKTPPLRSSRTDRTVSSGEFRKICSVFFSLKDISSLKVLGAGIKKLSSEGYFYLSGIENIDKGIVAVLFCGLEKMPGNPKEVTLNAVLGLLRVLKGRGKAGISYGEAFCGMILNRKTALSQSVNLAARLMQKASSGEAIISDDMRHYGFETVLKGSAALKGFNGKRDLYKVKGEKEFREEPLITEGIGKALRSINYGRKCSLIPVGGVKGCGKSFFLRYAASKVKGLESLFISYPRNEKFFVFKTLIGKLLGTERLTGEKLHRAFVSKWGAVYSNAEREVRDELKGIEPFLSDIFGIPLKKTRSLGLSAEARLKAECRSLKKFLKILINGKAFALFWDDLAQSDYSDLEMIKELKDSDIPLTIVTAGEEQPAILLDALTVEEHGEFIKRIFGYALKENVNAILYKVTKGNPLFTRKLFEYILSGGYLESPRLHALIEDFTLETLYLSEYDRLSADEKTTLRNMALFCDEIPLSVYRKIFGNVPECAVIEQLKRKGILHPAGRGNYIIKDTSFRNAVESLILFSNKKPVYFELYRSAMNDADAYRAGLYADKAGEKIKAKRAFGAALKVLSGGNDNLKVLDIYDRLEKMSETPELKEAYVLKKLEVLERLGRWDGLEERYRDLLKRAKKADAVRSALASFLCAKGLFDLSEKELEKVENAAYLSDKKGTLALIAMYRMEYGKAEEYFKSVINEENDRRKRFAAEMNLALVFMYNDKLAESLKIYRRALRRKKLQLDLEVNILGNLGNVHYNLRNMLKAERYYKEQYKEGMSILNDKAVMNALGSLGNIYMQAQKLSKALRYYGKALKIAEMLGSAIGSAIIFSNILKIFFEMNRFRELYQELERFRTYAELCNDTYSILSYHQFKLYERIILGDKNGFIDLFREYEKRFPDLTDNFFECLLRYFWVFGDIGVFRDVPIRDPVYSLLWKAALAFENSDEELYRETAKDPSGLFGNIVNMDDTAKIIKTYFEKGDLAALIGEQRKHNKDHLYDVFATRVLCTRVRGGGAKPYERARKRLENDYLLKRKKSD